MSDGRTKLLLTLLQLLVIHATAEQPIKTRHVHTVSYLEVAATGHCDGTLYPDLCASTLSAIPNVTSKSLPEIIASAVNHTITAVHSAGHNCTAFHRLDPRQMIALGDCIELVDTTVDQLRRAVSDLEGSPSTHLADLSTVLSAAMTNQYTCLDGFAYVEDGGIRPRIESRFTRISRLISNSLAMSQKIPKKYNREEFLEGYGETTKSKFPAWMSVGDRRLLQATTNVTKANLVVAKDGTGNFKTIGEALAAAPNNSATRFVIYIKAGSYFENVEVVKKQTNIMFIGDGIVRTVIKASRNVVDGWTTFRSATVAAVGNGFLARDLTIENSAGPSKHQAVALRTGSDLSAFYRCSFVGYQDTLYVHSLRQFYRECDIYGTVDFIFGDATVVFQSCNIYARKPDPNQKNIVTAQGRQDPNQNTGISIQNCKIAAASDLIPVQKTFPTYLGRPWKEYSRTVYLQSEIGGHIDPAGWLEWAGDFALSTLFYGEYENRGPGSNTSGRVKWPGYRVITNTTVANQFTVASFLQGDQWLGASMFPFLSGLS